VDKKYWENYYKVHGQDRGISEHSSFAKFCVDKFFFQQKLNIVELGSGNGRDAIYFAHNNHNVIALDQSTVAIDAQRAYVSDEINSNLSPVAEDFVQSDFMYGCAIDVFYSRFTLHAIDQNDEDLLLPKVYSSLKKGGLFCVEVRTTKDHLYGVGEYCGDNTYLTDHRRRFIDSDKFLRKTLSLGLNLLYFNEENGLSVYKDDDPVLMRVILKKE
jgi:tellurite methyltransferase